ncbi:MAG: hypothetical protein LBS05_05925 [Tannerellaceae bacterium]|jgi:hypothetical protein|nr:hypothetical protein [Tannerellaceae bacterium]
MNKNKNKKFYFLCLVLLLAGLSSHSSGQSLEMFLTGTWIVRQDSVQKTTDNVNSIQNFTATSRMNGLAGRPRSIVITPDSLTLRYDGYSESGPYSIEGNCLWFQFDLRPCEFTYYLTGDGGLILSSTGDYTIDDLMTGKTEDPYTIYARKQETQTSDTVYP